MKYRYRYSARQKYLKYVLIGATTILIGGMGYKIYSLNSTLAQYQAQTGDLGVEKPVEYINILVANKDLSVGEVLKEVDFDWVEVEKTEKMLNVTDLKQIANKKITTSIKTGDALMSTMLVPKDNWYDKGDRYVEHIFMDGVVPTAIPQERIEGSLVDILVFIEGMEDQVVIEKTSIITAAGNTLGFHLSYDEMIKLKEASTKGYLYLAFYLDDDQEPNRVTYVPPYEIKNSNK